MMILKTAWDEVTEKTILNRFRKSGITVEAQTNDDPFREIMDDGEDNCCRRVRVRPESTLRN